MDVTSAHSMPVPPASPQGPPGPAGLAPGGSDTPDRVSIGAVSDHLSSAVNATWGSLVLSYGILGVIVFLYFLFRGITNIVTPVLALPAWAPLAAVGIASLVLVWPMSIILRRLRARTGPSTDVPARCDPAARVRAIVTSELASRLRADEADMRRNSFEVEVVRAWFGRAPGAKAHAVLWPAALLALACMWLLDHLIPGRSFFTSTLSLQLFAAFSIGSLAAELAWPTYLRVSPGRLDVLEYGLFGLGRVRQRSFDLRSSRVHVNLCAFAVVIEPPDGRERLSALRSRIRSDRPIAAERIGGFGASLALAPSREDFLWKVLQGSITEAPGAPLPDDAWTD